MEKGDSSEKELFRFINHAIENIEKYDLPNAWRLIYTIRGGKAIVVSVILKWMTYKDYERRLNY